MRPPRLPPPRAPLFLARYAYRHRRLTDAARLLPLLGAFLFLLPVFWRPQETAAADTAPGGLYIFAVWGLLILVAAVLARVLGGREVEEGQDAPVRGGGADNGPEGSGPEGSGPWGSGPGGSG